MSTRQVSRQSDCRINHFRRKNNNWKTNFRTEKSKWKNIFFANGKVSRKSIGQNETRRKPGVELLAREANVISETNFADVFDSTTNLLFIRFHFFYLNFLKYVALEFRQTNDSYAIP